MVPWTWGYLESECRPSQMPCGGSISWLSVWPTDFPVLPPQPRVEGQPWMNSNPCPRTYLGPGSGWATCSPLPAAFLEQRLCFWAFPMYVEENVPPTLSLLVPVCPLCPLNQGPGAMVDLLCWHEPGRGREGADWALLRLLGVGKRVYGNPESDQGRWWHGGRWDPTWAMAPHPLSTVPSDFTYKLNTN